MTRFPPPFNRNPRLREIALYQQRLILCVLAQIVLYVIVAISAMTAGAAEAAAQANNTAPPEASPLLAVMMVGALLGMLAVGIFALIQIYKLAQAIWESTGLAVLLALLMLAPCISLVVLLVVSARATSTLRAAGIHVGFLGVSAAERARLG